MSLFYFHLVSDGELVRDHKGKEFSDLVEAYYYVRSLIHKAVMYDIDWEGWSIRITDASDRSILSVLFPQTSHYCSEKDKKDLLDHGTTG
jgi:hypothetical protein